MRRINFLILMVGMFLSFSLGAMEDEKKSSSKCTDVMMQGCIVVPTFFPIKMPIDDELQQKWKDFGISFEVDQQEKKYSVLPVQSFKYRGHRECDWKKNAPNFILERFKDVDGKLGLRKEMCKGTLEDSTNKTLLFPCLIPSSAVKASTNVEDYEDDLHSIVLRLSGYKEVSVLVVDEQEQSRWEMIQFQREDDARKKEAMQSLKEKLVDLQEITADFKEGVQEKLENKKPFWSNSFLQKSVLAGSVLIALYIFSKSLLGQDLLNRMRFILYMNGF
jgi:hypothetical protein